MATVAISHTSFQTEEVVPFGSTTHVSSYENTESVDPERSREIDAVAQLLYALSTHTGLREAMMSYHAELPEAEAVSWTDQVLRRMDTLLTPNLASDLNRNYDYTTPWIKSRDTVDEDKPSILTRIALPGVVMVGMAMFAMCVVGFVTTFHYLFAK